MVDKYDILANALPDAASKAAFSSATRLRATPAQLRQALLPYFAEAEKFYKLPKNLLVNMAQKESTFLAPIVWGVKKSPAGAVGILQFMPRSHPGFDAKDPVASIYRAGEYIRKMINQFDADKKKSHGNPVVAAVAAYNWGRGNILNKGLARAPAETKNYVFKILGVTV